ncbi:MAG: TRAPP subunit [Candelina submexicana]|nr:MAG: TRAPP subunit [Candelina submexicana]
MSYYFAIVGTKDNPLFDHEFGTSKQGGDGVARFREEARHMNQFIVHSSLDIVEEVQWGNGQMYALEFHPYMVDLIVLVGDCYYDRYLKVVDRFHNNYISCFLTGGNIKFLLLHAPSTPTPTTATNTSRSSTSVAANPTAPATEEAIRQFMMDVYEVWVKTLMNPFYSPDMEIRSSIFRSRVAAAGKKYL